MTHAILKKAIRFFWHLQPRGLRAFELELAEILFAHPLNPARDKRPGDIVVCGFHGTASGLGQGARQLLSFFKNRGLPAYAANASLVALLEDFEAGPLWPKEAKESGLLFYYINPDILHLIWNAVGRKRAAHRHVVGLWFWELEKAPPKWSRAARLVDEIWAPSHFVAGALRKIAGNTPVHIVPVMIDVSKFRSTPINDPLPSLKDKTIVFFTYDLRSLHARKNPEAVIEAFRRAAADRKEAHLVLKISNAESWPEALVRLQKAAEGLENFTLLKEKLSDDGMKDLLARADIIMSLHRAEGFGLLMAEGMAASKPVIATGWSSNLDFMTPETSILVSSTLIPVEDPQHIYDKYEACWAEPNIEEAAAALKDLLDHPEKRKALGQKARTHAEEFFDPERWVQNLPDSFRQYLA